MLLVIVIQINLTCLVKHQLESSPATSLFYECLVATIEEEGLVAAGWSR